MKWFILEERDRFGRWDAVHCFTARNGDAANREGAGYRPSCRSTAFRRSAASAEPAPSEPNRHPRGRPRRPAKRPR